MLTRVGAFLLFAAVLCGGPSLVADENCGGGSDDPLVVERTCQFQMMNPPILIVSPCFEIRDRYGVLAVLTNSRTLVSITHTEFARHERDCEGNVLETIDTIPSFFDVFFLETPHCRDGAPLEVRDLEGDNWCVNPHRGGYAIALRVLPGEADLCDDAGCYVAEVKVTITAEPIEDCEPRE